MNQVTSGYETLSQFREDNGDECSQVISEVEAGSEYYDDG